MKTEGMPGPSLRRFHPNAKAPVRLICLPHAGSAASTYYGVSRALSEAAEVWVVQYPGRQDRLREPLIGSVEGLADMVYGDLGGERRKPTYLFGHSLGAHVAFEVAKRMQAAGSPAGAVFASGRRAPSRPRDTNVHFGDDDELIAEIRSMGGVDDRILASPVMRNMFLPVVRSDYQAAENYRCLDGTRLSCPIYVAVGDDDPKTTVEEAYAWRNHTTGEFELRVYPGGHFFVDAHLDDLAKFISARF